MTKQAIKPMRRLSIAEMRAKIEALEADNAVLRGALAASGEEWPHPPADWAMGLTRQEGELLGALIRVEGRMIDLYALLEIIPSPVDYDARDPRLITVLVSRIRAKFGEQIIRTHRGSGYSFGCFREGEGPTSKTLAA